jgi:hypothetical protein
MWKLLLFFLSILFRLTSALPAKSQLRSPLPLLMSTGRRFSRGSSRNHHLPPDGATETYVPTCERPRDVNKAAFDAWLGSTHSIHFTTAVTAAALLASIIAYALLTPSNTDISLDPKGLGFMLRAAATAVGLEWGGRSRAPISRNSLQFYRAPPPREAD